MAVVEWVDPPFTAGHWVPDLVRAAGGEPVGASPGERSVQTSWSEIGSANPDVVIVAPCGYHLDGAAAQAEQILAELPAVQVWAIDADGIVVRPGPRLVDGVEAIACALHPAAMGPLGSVGRKSIRLVADRDPEPDPDPDPGADSDQRRALLPGTRPVTSL